MEIAERRCFTNVSMNIYIYIFTIRYSNYNNLLEKRCRQTCWKSNHGCFCPWFCCDKIESRNLVWLLTRKAMKTIVMKKRSQYTLFLRIGNTASCWRRKRVNDRMTTLQKAPKKNSFFKDSILFWLLKRSLN
jgi:hypothetical protein